MAKRYDTQESLRRAAVKKAEYTKIAAQTALAYQTVSRYAQGDPNTRGHTEMLIAMGTYNVFVKKIESLKKQLKEYEDFMPALKEWVYATQEDN